MFVELLEWNHLKRCILKTKCGVRVYIQNMHLFILCFLTWGFRSEKLSESADDSFSELWDCQKTTFSQYLTKPQWDYTVYWNHHMLNQFKSGECKMEALICTTFSLSFEIKTLHIHAFIPPPSKPLSQYPTIQTSPSITPLLKTQAVTSLPRQEIDCREEAADILWVCVRVCACVCVGRRVLMILREREVQRDRRGSVWAVSQGAWHCLSIVDTEPGHLCKSLITTNHLFIFQIITLSYPPLFTSLSLFFSLCSLLLGPSCPNLCFMFPTSPPHFRQPFDSLLLHIWSLLSPFLSLSPWTLYSWLSPHPNTGQFCQTMTFTRTWHGASAVIIKMLITVGSASCP